MWGRRHYDFVHKPAVQAAGGILVAWNTELIEVLDRKVGNFSISIFCRNKADGLKWAFSGVYGPTDQSDFSYVSNELGLIGEDWGVPWCLGGDFNVVKSPKERRGTSHYTQNMQMFNNFIEEWGLVDLPLRGAKYTWTNNQSSKVCSRLDRFLLLMDWLDFKAVSQETIPCSGSDHVPVLLAINARDSGPCPFKFELMWLEVAGFKELIKEWWMGFEVNGSASYRLAQKLKMLKFRIIQWRKEVFRGLEERKMAALNQIEAWDLKDMDRGLEEDERRQRGEAEREYNQLLKMEEIS